MSPRVMYPDHIGKLKVQYYTFTFCDKTAQIKPGALVQEAAFFSQVGAL